MQTKSPEVHAELQTEFIAQSAEGPAMLVVGGRATYHEAPDLRRSLVQAISATGDGLLMVDLSGVYRMDTASMAVLVEGMISTKALATEIFLCGPADTVRSVFRMAGLDEALGKCASCREEALRMIEQGLD